MIMVVFEGVIVAYSVINLILMIKRYKRFHSIYPVIAVFDLVMVVPLFLEMFLGIPDIPRDVYMNFVRAMEDQTTLFIYCLFVLLAQLMFTYELKRIKKLDRRVTKTNDIQEFLLFIQNFKQKKIVTWICYLIIIASALSIVFAPNPMYFLSFRSVFGQVPGQIANYSKNIVTPIFELLIGAIIALKLFDLKNGFGSCAFRAVLIAFFTMVNGKRTYLMIIVGVFFLIDLLRENIRSEKDILKLVNTIIANTKGDGEKSGEDFWVKAERLLYCALIGYIYYEAPEEEQNFSTLLEFINASEAREDDEEFKNPVDELFEDLEKAKPEHFAVRQYKKYKLAAGDICSK